MLTRDYPPAYGGISTCAHKLVQKLRELGVDVDVYCGRSDWKTLTLPLTLNFDGYDLVHVQSPAYGAFVRGKPLVVTVHSPIQTEFPYYSLDIKAISVPGMVLERMALLRANAVIAVSESTREELARRAIIDREKTIVIPNGVDLTLLSGERSHHTIGPLRILVVSRLEPRKGVETVISALASVQTKAYTLEIVGEGSLLRTLESMAKELGVRARFTGKLSELELARQYLNSDVVVAPGRSEGYGLTLLEGGAAGNAVLASDIPPHRAILGEGWGLTFRDAGDLRRRLIDLAANRELVRSLGERARKMAALHTWDRAAKNVISVYETVLRRAGRNRSAE